MRATLETTAPGAKLSATIARFCSSFQRRRRSTPVITSTLAIVPSLAPVQTLSFALVLNPPPISPQGGPHRTGTLNAQSLSFNGPHAARQHDVRGLAQEPGRDA